MTKDDVLFGYRLQLFAEAARMSNVSAACRTFGVHRSTYYAWKRQVDRQGLEMLRPRERRRPQMPNALPKMIEERIVSFSIAHPGLGPKRVASELAREKWGGIIVSPNGVWKVLCRHGLNTRAKRLGLIAGYAAPYEPPRDPGPEQHINVDRPGELVGIDCFYVGRLKGTEGAIWQLTAIDIASSYAWAELVICKQGNPTAQQTSRLAKRVAGELKAAGWRLERVLSDNGNEFRGVAFSQALERVGARHSRIHAGRPQTNGNVEALHKTILDECWRPAFARYIYPRYTGLRRELDSYLTYYNTDRVHHGRLTRGRIPADIVYGARKMEAR
ncbi:MAG TPA: DDE-type integrase/transposase/recombinase [Solirubrobacteraceae bacterium]|nr:DDE-type integrase/transposase/recombinase [Solirubrobacteraceae bacterium]